ncbi:MAG: hypothetical protein P8Q55_04660 [Candidatus Poseidoniaceae archaeon]|nr:hypothetical protein [Candidatus Poseidoniaceae archaeon]
MRRGLSLLVTVFLVAFFIQSFEDLQQSDTLSLKEIHFSDDDSDGYDSDDQCPSVAGNSTDDRIGCIDSDGDGYSDADENWNLSDGADAFPQNSQAWSDLDGDGYTDQPNLDITDDCPSRYGKSRQVLWGCADMDLDWIPDVLDTDIDGDGISNELEIASSNALFQYNPLDPNSFPLDSDYDMIPDAVDDDDDNDGWPDLLEQDRGSDPLDSQNTPFNKYFGIKTGFFYLGGFDATSDYKAEAVEISVSGLLEVVTEELIIPFLLVPIYFFIFYSRRRYFKQLILEISHCKYQKELNKLEKKINLAIEGRKIKTFHGLILRNKIEERENDLSLEEE